MKASRALTGFTLSAVLWLGACQSSPDVALDMQEQEIIRHALQDERDGKIDEAIDGYRMAMTNSKGGVDGHLALSRLYLSQGQALQAKTVLESAKKLQPDHPEVNLRLAKIAIAEDQPKQAETYIDDGLKTLPNDADLLNGKAVALDMQSRHVEAQQLYQRILQREGGDKLDFVRNNLALSFLMSGNADQAIETLRNVPTLDAQPVMRQNLALANGVQGDMEEARRLAGDQLSAAQLDENIAFYRRFSEMQQRALPNSKAVPVPVVTISEPAAPPNAKPQKPVAVKKEKPKTAATKKEAPAAAKNMQAIPDEGTNTIPPKTEEEPAATQDESLGVHDLDDGGSHDEDEHGWQNKNNHRHRHHRR